jgi:RNA polymerase sigma-70 factor (ECF subfamily)
MVGIDIKDRIARARRGDRRAMDAILEGHMATVYRFVAVKLGSDHPALEDVVQETLIGALGSIQRLRGDDEAALVRWLLTIARFKVADHLRARYAHPTDPLDAAPSSIVDSTAVSPEEVVTDRARSRELRQALSELTPEQEEILTLKYVLGYENQQIAAITGRTVGAVKALQHRRLATLESRLAGGRAAWS